jgi:hypothetical protein
MATTWANVLTIAPELANVASLQSVEAQALFMSDALAQMNPAVWGSRLEIGQRFLTAHLATLSLFQSRGIGTGGLRSPGAGHPNDYAATPYGTRYRHLQRQLPAARFAIAAPCYEPPPPSGSDDTPFG